MKGVVALETVGILLTVATLFVAVCPFPLHASCKITCLAAVVVVIAFISAVYAIIGVNGFPMHASCAVHWDFDEPCSNVSHTIIDQIKKWTGPEGCKKGGQRCLYQLKSVQKSAIKATHMTPVKKYVDDLSFMFSDKKGSKGCTVNGYSRSEVWYALLDYGTNYCNLHNLITGAGLDKGQGYKETTSNSVCTQYSVANCDKY